MTLHAGILAPNFEADYRRRSNTPSVSLIRKRCGCGAVITAAQHKRSGKCVKCVVATAFVAKEKSANDLPVDTTMPESGQGDLAAHQTIGENA